MSIAPRMGIASVLQAPIVFVTGKGGVGKTTVAAAIALGFARRHQGRVALVEFDDPDAGERALTGADAPVEHLVVPYERALEDAIALIVGGALIARTLLRHSAVRRLVRAIPALREFVSLEKVRALRSSGAYGRLVVDLPASGHAIDWLRVPGAFERFLSGGPLGALGRRIQQEVVAPGQCDVVIVTLAEPLVMRETEQLAARFVDELGHVPALLVANRTAAEDPPNALEAARQLTSAAPGEANAAEFYQLLLARTALAQEAKEALRLAHGLATTRVVTIPEAPTDPGVMDVLRWLDAGATGE